MPKSDRHLGQDAPEPVSDLFDEGTNDEGTNDEGTNDADLGAVPRHWQQPGTA